MEQAREMAAREFGDADYFSLDTADVDQLRYAVIFDNFLREQMRTHAYIYVPLHSARTTTTTTTTMSIRHRTRGVRRSTRTPTQQHNENERQKLMFIYDPPREKQARDANGAVIPTADGAPPPLKKMTDRQQHRDIQKQMMRIDRAFFVRRDSAVGTCQITVLNRALFAQALTFLATQAYYDVVRPRPARIVLVSSLMSFLRSPSTCFLQEMMFMQLPSIVTSFALNLPHLRRLHALLPVEIGAPPLASNATTGVPYEMNDVDIAKLDSVTAATSMLNSADVSDDDDDDNEEDGSSGSSRSSGTQTPATSVEFEAMINNEHLLTSLAAVAADARRSGTQQHPFFDQLSDTEWMVTRLCWFVVGFKYVFMNEADCSLGAKWSHVDLFYFLNQLQAHVEERPHLGSMQRAMGDARQFFREQTRASATLPSDVRQSAQSFIGRMRDKVFVNDAKTPEIVCERLTRGVTEALYSSREIYERVGEVFAEVHFAELINRFQIRSTHRQRFDSAVAVPCALVPQHNVNAEVLEYVERHGLLFEERRLKQLVAQSPVGNCLDVVCKLNYVNSDAITPLTLVSSIREVCPSARAGVDFLLLYTPLSMIKTAEHAYHCERQRASPPYTMRSLDEDAAHYRANLGKYTPTVGNLYGAAVEPAPAAPPPPPSPTTHEPKMKRKLHATRMVGPDHCLLLMKSDVWRTVSDATHAAILIQRSRSSNEFAKVTRQNDFVPLCAPLAARALCRVDCNDETRCNVLNAFSALCGGSKCEWTAGSPRAEMFAARVANLVVRICHVEIQGDAQSVLKVVVAPLCTHLASIDYAGEVSSRRVHDAAYSSFYSLMQLVLNGNVLSIGCCNEAQWIELQRLTQHSVFWIEYLRDCYMWEQIANNTSMPPPAARSTSMHYDNDDNNDDDDDDDDSGTGVEREPERKFVCECGGAQSEECDRMFREQSAFCCVCMYNNSQHAPSASRRRRQQQRPSGPLGDEMMMSLCDYCRDRVPYRGANRVLLAGAATASNTTAENTAPTPLFVTLFDSNDPRRPTRASLIELAEYLLDCADRGDFTHGEALRLLSALRFNLLGYPSRVAVPRGRLNRNDKKREIHANLVAYAERLEREERDSVTDINAHAASRDEFVDTIVDPQLREILQKTAGVRQWRGKASSVATTTTSAPDVAPADEQAWLSLTLVMTCLEIISVTALRPLLQFAAVYERAFTTTFGTGDERAVMKTLCEVRALLQLLAPLRDVDELRTYTSNIDRKFALVPLCNSALAEATMFDKRSMTTLASSHKVPLEATLEHMLYNKTIERPATQAVQGMLEFLFVNSCNLDRAPRQQQQQQQQRRSAVPLPAHRQQSSVVDNNDDGEQQGDLNNAGDDDEDTDLDDKRIGNKKLRQSMNT